MVSDRIQDMIHVQSIALDLEHLPERQLLQRAQAEASNRPVHIITELAQLGQSSICLVGVVLPLLTFNCLIAAMRSA